MNCVSTAPSDQDIGKDLLAQKKNPKTVRKHQTPCISGLNAGVLRRVGMKTLGRGRYYFAAIASENSRSSSAILSRSCLFAW